MTPAGRRRLLAGMAIVAVASLVGCGGEERLDAETFCDEFVAIGDSAQGAADGIASGLRALAPKAPTAELGDDVEVLADVFDTYARVANEGGDAGAELATLGEDPEVSASVTRFGDFLTEECGIELGSTLEDGTAPTPDASPDVSTVPEGSTAPDDSSTIPAG